MTYSTNFRRTIAIAERVIGQISTKYDNVLLPSPFVQNIATPIIRVDAGALWTLDGYRPRWDNLGILADEARGIKGLDWWKQIVSTLKIPLGIITVGDQVAFIRGDQNQETKLIDQRDLAENLERERIRLFAPSQIAAFRHGRLTFADLEDDLSLTGLSQFFRQHQKKLDESLSKALLQAILVQTESDIKLQDSKKDSERSLKLAGAAQSVFEVGIAYLGARILEDKGLFKSSPLGTNDVKILLEKVLGVRNGFFERAYYIHLPKLHIDTLRTLAAYIGNSVTFSLTDHRDVGRLYENAVKIIQQQAYEYVDIDIAVFPDLERHYTPLALAERMLERLPLERLRPEERIIYDPAAGSGSLLLAATSRLKGMQDIPDLEKKRYLSSQIIGNDLDPLAKLVTRLRYALIQESFGNPSVFPEPENFLEYDYNSELAWNVDKTPNVIVANPPYSIAGNRQTAVEFLQKMIQKLPDKGQFAVVLPQIALQGVNFGWNQIRRDLSEKCDILEVWQFPEGVVGLSARQPVCVVLGAVGHGKNSHTISRAVFTGARSDAIRERGFLGQNWISQVNSGSADWSSTVVFNLDIEQQTIALGDLYKVIRGVELLPGEEAYNYKPNDPQAKRYWTLSWKDKDFFWINPIRVPHRYIIYDKKHLRRGNFANQAVYDSNKIILSRSSNRNSDDHISPYYDTERFYPGVHSLCVVPKSEEELNRDNVILPHGWRDISYDDKLMWLFGILKSSFGRIYSMSLRNSRHFTSGGLKNFPLPMWINRGIIDNVISIIETEKVAASQIKDVSDYNMIFKMNDGDYIQSVLSKLKAEMNELVEADYGKPDMVVNITRVGSLPELEQWYEEHKKPVATVTGQVLGVDRRRNKILLHLEGISDEKKEFWINIPLDLPGWALDGSMFTSDISKTVASFEDLQSNRWAIRNFVHTPRPYLDINELYQELFDEVGDEN